MTHQKDSQLQEWVLEHSANGIKQHSRRWLAAKVNTIGGSSLATIQNNNPYSDIAGLISEKIGLTRFTPDIKPQWGNLFEDVVKCYVEHDKACKILGEDLFVEGPQGTAYSPDGLAVMDTSGVHGNPPNTQEVVLCEFKCPYSRIPTDTPPKYYIPQVKMGLDVLGIPAVGLLAEAVFRRCCLSQLGSSTEFNRTLTTDPRWPKVYAHGIIGFYFDDAKYTTLLEKLSKTDAAQASALEWQNCALRGGAGASTRQLYDLGAADHKLVVSVMNAYESKVLRPWYGPISFCDGTGGGRPHQEVLGEFTRHCADNNYVSYGVLPWKLFQVKYHYIQKEPNYLAPWLPKIREIVEIVRRCNDPANSDVKVNLFNSYLSHGGHGGFSDDC
jgi:hypothetical protein